MLKKELNVFFTAVMFYTRIPVPSGMAFSDEILNKATRYFPLIGIIVGGIGALVFWMLHLILPFQVSVILSMAATIFVTGAFHEDAFSDFCDGFGGGYTPERILEIMKDSRIGTYGAVAILLMLSTKFFCLTNIEPYKIPLILISGHAFSRFMSVCMIYTSNYVRADTLSKSKPIGHKGSAFSLLVAGLFGLIALCFIPVKAVVVIIALSIIVFISFRWYVHRKLGGYTGDVLGALQQLSEISFYLCFLVYKQNIL